MCAVRRSLAIEAGTVHCDSNPWSRCSMRAATGLVLTLCAGMAFAKMPVANEEAKAKAAEASAKSAWSDKVANYKLCQAQDRVAAKYRTTAMSSGKPALQPVATPPCADPGPYAP